MRGAALRVLVDMAFWFTLATLIYAFLRMIYRLVGPSFWKWWG